LIIQSQGLEREAGHIGKAADGEEFPWLIHIGSIQSPPGVESRLNKRSAVLGPRTSFSIPDYS
jgi:hypothetical protein